MRDPKTKARNYVYMLLSKKSYTKKEIIDRLKRKLYEEDVIAAVVKEFEEEGWLNDRRYARAFAADSKTFNRAGKRLVRMKLMRKGVDSEIIESAVEKAYEGVDEYEMALELASKRMRSLQRLEKPAAARRLQGYLARKGYNIDVIIKVVKKVLSGTVYDEG